MTTSRAPPQFGQLRPSIRRSISASASRLGFGVPPEVPSLRDTLAQFVTSAEGRGYLVRVPGVAQSRLNDQELAEVINWVLTEFNASSLPPEFQPFSAGEVAAVRGDVLADPAGYRGKLIATSLAE